MPPARPDIVGLGGRDGESSACGIGVDDTDHPVERSRKAPAHRELTRRRGRSILTIAVAIAGVWLFAIPSNVGASLQRRVRTDAMHTARLAPNAADLDDEQFVTLRVVGNVAARGEVVTDGENQDRGTSHA